MLVVYGLKNCDTCRKATRWLTSEAIDFSFVDVRKDGIDLPEIRKWAAAVGWEKLLNRQSTTWRSLPDALKDEIDEARATALMADHPALIKRPVFDQAGVISVGFKEADKSRLQKQPVS
ncbi:MAG: arsenate reductase [Rhodospirillales bacterium]|nr:arsenate reductase [Rhodospirillales bacterium]